MPLIMFVSSSFNTCVNLPKKKKFSLLTCESDSLVLERTESDLSKINRLRGVILLIPIVLVP